MANPPRPLNNRNTTSQQTNIAPAEQVRGPAAEQHEPAVAECVEALTIHCSSPVARPSSADGRQRDAHHRDVDAFQKDRAAEHEQNGPGAAGQPLLGDG